MGIEDLTPDQLMTITWLIFIAIMSYIAVHFFQSIIHLKISKNIKLNVKKELVQEVQEKLNKPTAWEQIKLWWSERKMKKELDTPYKVPKKFK